MLLDSARFVRDHTQLAVVPFVPELRMYMSVEAIALWEQTERMVGTSDLAPPFWAFPWAGGQALARYVLDHPQSVAGRRVLDLAAGSGLVGIAAAAAGAAQVWCNEIDPFADAAIELNAAANGVTVTRIFGDLLEQPVPQVDMVLAGDVFYSRQMARQMTGFLRRAAAQGAQVLVGDPQRAYRPQGSEFEQVAAYQVPVIRDLEDAEVKPTAVLRLSPAG